MGRPFFRKRGEGRGGNPILGMFIVVMSFVLAVFSYRLFPAGGSKPAQTSLAAFASRLGPESRPMRIEILEAGPSSTRLRMKLLDLSGKEISILERSVPGEGLALGFWLLPVQSGEGESSPRLVFPRRFSADGSLLYEAYSVSGFPAIFGGLPPGSSDGAPLSEAERKALSSVFSALARADALKAKPSGAAAAATSLELSFAAVESGGCYDIWVSRDGRVFVRPAK